MPAIAWVNQESRTVALAEGGPYSTSEDHPCVDSILDCQAYSHSNDEDDRVIGTTQPTSSDTTIKKTSMHGRVSHFERKLVCRPGLPKGVAFRPDEMGNGGRFRKNRYRRDPFSDNWDGPSGDNSIFGGYDDGTSIAFRPDEMGNGGRFRKNRYRRDPFSDNWDGPSGDNSTFGGCTTVTLGDEAVH
ncbi:hypothetical protein LQW54_003269 [Pestalotiopsis sp. IQ-011]